MKEKKQCSNCRFSQMIDSAYYKCRRYPPNQEFYRKRFRRWRKIVFPIVEWDMKCGEYKPYISKKTTKGAD
ncbi:MAG: hypothetical protein PHW73_01755 [Atribacterota bacterium]|nr:hypothetical protein [Atribacterota bacterium]